MKRCKIKIEGIVQGVGFRFSARKAAMGIGVSGFVKNMPDGSVYAEAEAEEKKINEFISWCKKGPPAARVEKIIVTEMEVKHSEGFYIKT